MDRRSSSDTQRVAAQKLLFTCCLGGEKHSMFMRHVLLRFDDSDSFRLD